jgi:hypothetical protein
MGRKGCLCSKDWFKPIFPLFLTWLFHKVPNTHDRFCPIVISRVTPIFRVKQDAKQTVLGLLDPKDEDAAMCYL